MVTFERKALKRAATTQKRDHLLNGMMLGELSGDA